MQWIKVGESTASFRRVYLDLIQEDGTPATGEAGGQPQISRNGGGFANTAGVLASVGSGLYYVELSTDECDALGKGYVRFSSGTARERKAPIIFVAVDPFNGASFGMSRLDAALTTRATPAEVLAQIESALGSVQRSELTGAPPDAPTLLQQIMTLYMLAKNLQEVSAAEQKVYNAAGQLIWKSALGQLNSVFSRFKVTTP